LRIEARVSTESGWPASTEPLTGVLNANGTTGCDPVAITRLAAIDGLVGWTKNYRPTGLFSGGENEANCKVKFRPRAASFRKSPSGSSDGQACKLRTHLEGKRYRAAVKVEGT